MDKEVTRLAKAACNAGAECVSLLEQLRKALENSKSDLGHYAALTIAEHYKAIQHALFQVSFLEGGE